MISITLKTGFPGGRVVKNLPANAGDTREMGSIPGSRRSPGVENGNPLQYSCLENSMDRGAWQTTVPGVAELDVPRCFNHVPLFAVLWTMAHQAALSMEFFQARILEWAAISSFRGSF